MKHKTSLLRIAGYVFVLAAVCAIPFALGQPNSNKSTSDLDRAQRPSLSDLTGSALVMRIPSLPVSQLLTRASGPTPTPIPGPCQFQVLIVYADAGPPIQFQTE